MKDIQDIRTLGEIITDSIKLIFRNLKALTTVLMLSVMLPAFGMTFILQINPFMSVALGEEFPVLLVVFLVISILFLLLHINLVSISLLLAGIEGNPNEISSKRIMYYFKKLYWKNLLVSSFFLFANSILIGLFIWIMVNLMFAGFFFLLLLGAFYVLYLYPYFFYTQRYYLTKPGMSLMKAFKNGRDDLLDNYGISIGSIFLHSLISSFLRYIVAVPFMLLSFPLFLGMDFGVEVDLKTYLIYAAQSFFLAIGSSYLYLYFYNAMYLKSYDLEERKTGETTIQKIQLIGTEKETFFENEGEY